MVEALQRRFKSEDPFIWFDVFSVSQHKAEGRPFEWWNTIFLNAVGDIGKLLMMMQPFTCKNLLFGRKDNEPEELEAWFTLTRVWCVFELFACESTQSQFDITMTKEMHKRLFNSSLQVDPEVHKSLDAVDCENSVSFKKEDRERVFEVIRKSVGFSNLNIMVKRKVETWLRSNCQEAREVLGQEKQQVKVCFCFQIIFSPKHSHSNTWSRTLHLPWTNLQLATVQSLL